MATRSGLLRWFPEFFDKYKALTVFDLLVEYIRSGRITLDKSRFPMRATYHEPCNYGRKSEEKFGHGYYDEARFILDSCLEDWVELYPTKANDFCCGGGGGTLLTPYQDARTRYARRKMDQIKRTGAELLVLPCHSCHGQIKAVKEAYGMPDLEVKYLWEVVAEAMVITS
jgi:Fe-S oxidoreductase